jgi:hypothetical protein
LLFPPFPPSFLAAFAAICSSFGVGKDKNLSSFVKIGTNFAIIEVELKGERNNIVIRREIKKASNESTWTVNGKRVYLLTCAFLFVSNVSILGGSQ